MQVQTAAPSNADAQPAMEAVALRHTAQQATLEDSTSANEVALPQLTLTIMPSIAQADSCCMITLRLLHWPCVIFAVWDTMQAPEHQGPRLDPPSAPNMPVHEEQAASIAAAGTAALHDELMSSRSASSVSLHELTVRESVTEMLMLGGAADAPTTLQTLHTAAADAQTQADAGLVALSSSSQAVQAGVPAEPAAFSRQSQDRRTAAPYRSRMVGTERTPSRSPSPPLSARGPPQQHPQQPSTGLMPGAAIRVQAPVEVPTSPARQPQAGRGASLPLAAHAGDAPRQVSISMNSIDTVSSPKMQSRDPDLLLINDKQRNLCLNLRSCCSKCIMTCNECNPAPNATHAVS